MNHYSDPVLSKERRRDREASASVDLQRLKSQAEQWSAERARLQAEASDAVISSERANAEAQRLAGELASAVLERESLKVENDSLRMAVRNQVDQDMQALRARQMVLIEECLAQAGAWAHACTIYFPALAERVKGGARELPSIGSQIFHAEVAYATCSQLTVDEMRAYVARFYEIVSVASDAAARAGYFTSANIRFALPPIAAQAADASKKHITL